MARAASHVLENVLGFGAILWGYFVESPSGFCAYLAQIPVNGAGQTGKVGPGVPHHGSCPFVTF